MQNPAVHLEKRGQVAIIRLNRPERMNAMCQEIFDDFDECMRSVQKDSQLRAVVITGSGRAFCAGADLRAPLQGQDASQPEHERSYAMYESFLRVLDIEVPVIGALNGHAVGGGFGLALLCDIRIACRKAKYGANFARLGIHSGLGISYTLPRLVGASEAARMLFTGALIDGDKGKEIGLFSSVAPAEQVLDEALILADQVVKAAPLAVRLMKRSLYQNLEWNPRAAARQEAHVQAQTLATQDAAEGVRAMLEKREAQFVGR